MMTSERLGRGCFPVFPERKGVIESSHKKKFVVKKQETNAPFVCPCLTRGTSWSNAFIASSSKDAVQPVSKMKHIPISSYSSIEEDDLKTDACNIVIAERCVEVPAEAYRCDMGENLYEAEVLTTDYTSDEDSLEAPLAAATPICIGSSICEASPKTSFSSCGCQEHTETRCTDSLPNHLRPEFIFASTFVHDAGRSNGAGIVLRSRAQGGVAVASISCHSPFRGSYIQQGDHVVAVNNFSCAESTVERVLDLLRASREKLSICVHNGQGDPRLVASTITKPDRTSKVFLTLQRRHNIIRIKDLGEKSLFNDSLLMPKQRCRQINGISCDIMSAHDAGEIISASHDQVTIVSEIQPSCAVTIALFEDTAWWKKLVAGLAMRPVGEATLGALP